MSNVLPFKKRAKKLPKRSTLCENGHHKWVVDTKSRFDTKSGKLVTLERCQRCDKRRVRGT